MKERMKEYCAAVEEYLNGCFAEPAPQQTLLDSMRYSLLAGGKRIRPVLVLEFCRVCGGDWKKALPFAAALEMIHTYSLIHDDLPCMDNDDYRRGRLTNHKVYGEACAVLAGDGLLTAAFGTALKAELPAQALVDAVRVLSACAGEDGMVGGQILDLEGEQKILAAGQIHLIHKLKTGALILAGCQLGVIAAGGTAEQLEAARRYASGIGLAFQLRDDILDVTGDAAKLGKKTGMDVNKNTFIKLYGLDRCEEMVKEETDAAVAALSAFADSAFLTELAAFLAGRDY
ncbi:MAG: polyprenyl synthetase family protein [Oscillospiraceae bacterium]|nr:polyprenyl synthetase family protein [Oscillospiraceae bacterium]